MPIPVAKVLIVLGIGQALLNGGRLHSAYCVKNVMLFVVTEAINEKTGQRDSTYVKLVSE